MVRPSAPVSARERVRRELTEEIKERALQQVAEHGAGALSLRGVAREMGMASSALFRYFPSRDALLTQLIVDSYVALADAAEAGEARVHDRTVEERWVAICHAVRDWALAHRHQYTLIFGSPVPGYAAPQDTVEPASRVPMLLGGLLRDAPGTDRDRVDASGDEPPHPPGADPAVVAAVGPVLEMLPGLPADLVVRGLMAWTYLFGAVSFEVFGHRHGVLADHDAFFDHEVRRLAFALALT